MQNNQPYKRLANNHDIIVHVASNLRFYKNDNPDYMIWEAAGNTPDPADPPSIDDLSSMARVERNARLAQADVEVKKLEDLGLDTSAWRAYRILLRDLPTTAGFPTTINWPLMP